MKKLQVLGLLIISIQGCALYASAKVTTPQISNNHKEIYDDGEIRITRNPTRLNELTTDSVIGHNNKMHYYFHSAQDAHIYKTMRDHNHDQDDSALACKIISTPHDVSFDAMLKLAASLPN